MATGLSPTCHIGQEVLAALDGRSSSGTQWSSSRRPQGGARDAMVCREWSVVGADMGKERLTALGKSRLQASGGSTVWPRAACERRAAGVGKVGSPLLGYDFFYFFFSFSKNKWTSQKKIREIYIWRCTPTAAGVPTAVGHGGRGAAYGRLTCRWG
jgi:hypothetical protein